MAQLVENRTVVVPGEPLAEGMDFLPAAGTYRQGEVIYANRFGLVVIDKRLIKLVPLSGRYVPKRGDHIIGKVIDINMGGWRVEINSPYTAMLSMKEGSQDFISRGADLTRYFDFGDYIYTEITNVTSQNLVDVTMKAPALHKLSAGLIIPVETNKVPRIIGKQGSMVTMLKEHTGCKIVVGQNGLVWIQGEPQQEIKVVRAIRKIEAEAHTPGLTERIQKLLEE